jgi:hypothetical protein
MDQLLLPLFVLMVLVSMLGGKPESVAAGFVGGVAKLLGVVLTFLLGGRSSR